MTANLKVITTGLATMMDMICFEGGFGGGGG